jgi:hypothetical protein
VGYATLDGDIRLIELPADALGNLRNYVGGLAVSNDRQTIAASSPVGGAVLTIDASAAKPSALQLLRTTCGVAPDGPGFIATNGFGEWVGFGGSDVPAHSFEFEFDEHLRVVG